ncbi:hypothetical protein [Archangium lansingense]|uniref:Uncharacterized protein n=1 Tax=Archangium lansingense TaxID=2995310 RepID=A0ABT3ZVF7_9BACT|nr:hypothetical protein [Archangium lansinium]MCY1073397.1 hypothetical protein [Archangium lansinium]
MPANHFQRIHAFYHELPRHFCAQLRLAVEARSAPDEFSCHCTLLESLTTYLNDLSNSVYLDRALDQANEALEAKLRGMDRALSFGHRIGSLRDFARLEADIQKRIPELAQILTAKTLPKECVRATKSFQAIKEARDKFHIPPSRILEYVRANVEPDDDKLGRGTLDAFLSVVVDFRNKGVGHRSEETWFPQDSQFFLLLNGFLAPALDALLSWEPLQAVLTRYETVEAELDTLAGNACVVRRPELLEGRLPLRPSRMSLQPHQRPEGRYLARRTHDSSLLEAVVPFHSFPKTLQSPEQLYQRYRREFLSHYLDKGVITPSQRRDELDVRVKKLVLSEERVRADEREFQQLVAACSNATDKEGQDAARQQLERLLGPEWVHVQDRVKTLLDQLPTRRKDYIYHAIENAFVMSFAQLKAESELSEPELERVLEELERERKIRTLNAGDSYGGRNQALFKLHDPSRPDGFRSILQQLEKTASPRRKHPELVWKLVSLCGKLLSDDGFPELQSEVQALRSCFEDVGTQQGPDDERSADDALSELSLQINGRDVQAPTVRALLEQVWKELQAQNIDVSASVPFLIGKTRYLVSDRPFHANGKPFVIPIPLGGYVFEGSLTRAQALNEIIRFLEKSGVKATSSNVEVEYESSEEALDDSTSESDERLGIIIRDATGAEEEVSGPTVRSFYSKLLSYLLEHQYDLSEVAPIRVGRIRYVLAEEPYHANGRRFQSTISRDGYYMETDYTHALGVKVALEVCKTLGIYAVPLSQEDNGQVELELDLGKRTVRGSSVPEFFTAAVRALYDEGLLTEKDIPYKSGRLRYFISSIPVHVHGREFISPVEVSLGGATYYIESNTSRTNAREFIQKLFTSCSAPAPETTA